jgi:hypothetical protein
MTLSKYIGEEKHKLSVLLTNMMLITIENVCDNHQIVNCGFLGTSLAILW